MANGNGEEDVQGAVDRAIRELMADRQPAEAAYVAAVVLNRAAAELHRLARAEAATRKGQADWGRWAGLQNAARNVVLLASTCRDSAAAILGRKR
ncbi:MAG: hypothetical protein IT307_13380 [Chloroflexi bacterium]|nr:hypothetical protein [Chloroflexota bacterium]